MINVSLTAEIAREMLSALPDPLFVITESGRYAAVLGGNDEGFYHDGSHLAGRFLHEVLPRPKADWFLKQVRLTLEAGRLRSVEYALAGDDVDGLDKDRGPEGDLWFEGRIQPMRSLFEGERAVVWVARNITARSELEAKLRHMSETDALTGAYNRRKLMEELRRRVAEFRRYGRPSTLILFDVDHFKRVNDTFGHAAGDDVLCDITTTCSQQLRDVDVLARIGGEEFAVLLTNTNLETGQQVAERLRLTIATEVMKRFREPVPVTISAGVTALRGTDETLDTVLRRCDEALYQAKRDGRNRIVIADAA